MKKKTSAQSNWLKIIISNKWTHRILFLLTLIVVGNYIFSYLDLETLRKTSLNPRWFLLAVGTNFIYILIYALIWHRVTRIYDSALPLLDAIAVWLFSSFGKYLPLGIIGIGYRLATYRQRIGKRYAEIGQMFYLEYLASLLGGFVILLALLFFLNPRTLVTKQNIYLYLGYALGLGLLLLPPVQNKLFNLGVSLLKREPLRVRMKMMASLSLVITYAAAWMTLGASLFFLTFAIYPYIELHDWFRITMVYILAGIAGMISVFAPSGIGVREGILMLGLKTIIPAPVAALVTILARLMTTVVDGLGILIGFVYLERAKRRESR